MIIDVSSRLKYTVSAPTSFIFNVAAAVTNRQSIVMERLTVQPDTRVLNDLVDLSENRIYRLEAEPGELELAYVASVDVRPRKESEAELVQQDQIGLPEEAIPYLYPSRYCPSDRLIRWAAKTFDGHEAGAPRVNAICDWTFEALDYVIGATNQHTDACEVIIARAGVCRDYAHVAITICRALGMPARYVSGYAVDLNPPDFHGFFEVYLGNAWYLFDATKMAPLQGFVRIGAGRDAVDCAFSTIVGAASLQEMYVTAAFQKTAPKGEGSEEISTA